MRMNKATKLEQKLSPEATKRDDLNTTVDGESKVDQAVYGPNKLPDGENL